MHDPQDLPAGRRLIWRGDNIGLIINEPVIVILRDEATPNPRNVSYTLTHALSVADQIDAYGLSRIVSGLMWASEHGYLCAADAAAWEAYGRPADLSQRDAS